LWPPSSPLHHPPGWLVVLGLPLAIGFDAFCLIDIARAAQVRYLPKWAGTLICLIQVPLGGPVAPEPCRATLFAPTTSASALSSTSARPSRLHDYSCLPAHLNTR
jgi:hypothetical protein